MTFVDCQIHRSATILQYFYDHHHHHYHY